MSLVYFVLAAYGLTQMIVYGRIFDKIRPIDGWFAQLLSCPMCVGFHVGWFLWLFRDSTELFNFDSGLVTAFLLSCLSSGTSYVMNMIFGDCGLKLDLGGKHETAN